jgi:hypothetical protein
MPAPVFRSVTLFVIEKPPTFGESSNRMPSPW